MELAAACATGRVMAGWDGPDRADGGSPLQPTKGRAHGSMVPNANLSEAERLEKKAAKKRAKTAHRGARQLKKAANLARLDGTALRHEEQPPAGDWGHYH